MCQFRILGDIERGQLIVIAIQRPQCCILGDIECGQFIETAIQRPQCCILGDIECGQFIVIAKQVCQFRILGDIECGQFIVAAIQGVQSRIPRNVELGQFVVAAIQGPQCREILDTFQAFNLLFRDIHDSNVSDFCFRQYTVFSIVLLKQIVPEVVIREVGLVDANLHHRLKGVVIVR